MMWVCSNRMPNRDGSCECGHGPHVQVGDTITCDECNAIKYRRPTTMSWGYEKTGTPDAITKDVTAYFDKTAEGYKGKPEADDVTACKDRILALIAACDFSDGSANAVNVKANGSHSASSKGIYSANFNVAVTRVSLAL
jgi:hypothetical protein